VFWRTVLGVVVLGAALMLVAPATLLDGLLATQSGNRLRLIDATGLWWRGRGAVATRDGAARVPIAWRVAFAPLLAGDVVVALHADDAAAMPAGTVALRRGAIDVRDLHVMAPVAFVAALIPALPPTTALHGELDLRAPSFAWRGQSGSGTLDATWQHAAIVAAASPIDLGRVVASVRPAADGLGGSVRNAGGDVAIDGTVSTHADVTSASIKLAPTARASQALRAMLPLLGAIDDAGTVTLTWRSDPH